MSLRCSSSHLPKHGIKHGQPFASFQRRVVRQASGAANAVAEHDAPDQTPSDAGFGHEHMQSDTQFRLQPVPPLRRAIFRTTSGSPESEDLPTLSQYVDSLVQGQPRSTARLWDEKRPPIPSSTFNALTARLRRLQKAPTLPQIFFGMRCAASNPDAMHQCLALLEEIPNRDRLHQGYASANFLRIATSICSQPEWAGNDWQRRRVKQQWLRIVTGWESNGIPQTPFEERQLCLYSIGSVMSTDFWQAYLRLLSRFGDANVVYNEWMLYQQSRPLEDTDGMAHDTSGERAVMAKRAVNATAQALVRLGDAERAWQIMYDFEGDLATSVEDASLDLLMGYPEHVREWLPFMEAPALSVLEREVQKVEGYLGLSWEGGEDGFHRPCAM